MSSEDNPPTLPAALATSARSKDSSASIAENNHARELLLRAGLMLSAYHWRLAKAGYPFREPAGLIELQNEIDAYLFPDDVRGSRGKAPR